MYVLVGKKCLMCLHVTDQGNDDTVMKRMIFGIATRIDLLEYIMHCGPCSSDDGISIHASE